MKRKVTLKRIFHRDAWRLGLFFDFDEKIKGIVKSLPGVSWSVTLKCFYLTDNEENLREAVKSLKDVAEIDISDISVSESIVKNRHLKGKDSPEVRRMVSGDENEPDFFPGVAGLSDDRSGIPGFDGFTPEDEQAEGIEKGPRSGYGSSLQRYGAVEFSLSEKEGLLIIKFLGIYDKEWIKEMRTYGRCYYDGSRREWLLPLKKVTADSLADYFSTRGVEVRVKKHVINEKQVEERKVRAEEIRHRDLSSGAMDALEKMKVFLEENRYSARTCESYLSALEFFFRYFSLKDPAEITGEEISRFIYDHIIMLGYSSSYQNQMVSAIKTYYMISGKGLVSPELISRPRRTRALPKVLSRDEVSRILNATRNSKHKTLLWMIYSCGLRRSEATNIKLEDLDRDRSIVHIREGKGRVDRIVPVSQKVWGRIDDYIRAYKPREYVFEGQSGGRYSSESVYNVFRGALKRAGIIKDVGVHSLRHSYATHLHESGLDIRYIQELLGHKSTRTTEIYTHVSRRNLVSVRSPIEDLDVS